MPYLPRRPRPWSHVRIVCFTCAHGEPRVAPGAIFAHVHCTRGLPNGGRKGLCGAYEREPGSDDEPFWMAPPPERELSIDDLDNDPGLPREEPKKRIPRPIDENLGARLARYAREDAAAAAAAKRPGRWRIVGVAT